MRKLLLILIIVVCSFSLCALVNLTTESNGMTVSFIGASKDEHFALFSNPAAVNYLDINRTSANIRFYNTGVFASSFLSYKFDDLNICVYGEKTEINKWQTSPYPWSRTAYSDNYLYCNEIGYFDNSTTSTDDDYLVTQVSDGIYYNSLNQFGNIMDFRIVIGKSEHGFLYNYNKLNTSNIPNGIQYDYQRLDVIEIGDSSPVESYYILTEQISENTTEYTTHTFSWGMKKDINADNNLDFAISIFHSSLSDESKSRVYQELDFDPDNDGNIVDNYYARRYDYEMCKNYTFQFQEESDFSVDGLGFGVFSRITKERSHKLTIGYGGKFFFQSLQTKKFNYFQSRIEEATVSGEMFYNGYSYEDVHLVIQKDTFGRKIEMKLIDAYIGADFEYHPIEELIISGAASFDVVLNKNDLHLYTLDEDLDSNPFININQTVKTELSIPFGVQWNIKKKFILNGIINSNVYLGTFESKFNYRSKVIGIAHIFFNFGIIYNLSDKIQLEFARVKETGFSDNIYSFSYSYSF